ncbi:MAG: WD40/YVTN/BNR-like repeat-containing protein [Nodosilinea sp.]
MGFVTGIVTHPTDTGLVYVRTDVGGIYRWDASKSEWIPLSDALRDRYSIESIALDPGNPNLIYAAAGGDLLKSSDRGQTWHPTPLRTAAGDPVKMDGNGDWRWAGERLAVDPNNVQIIYFASRFDGLFVSIDGAETWASVDRFPTAGLPTGGLTFVQFDPNSAGPGPTSARISQTIYVGATGHGIYRSQDGGQRWALLTNGPGANQNPQQAVVAKNSTLYVTTFTSADQPQGAVWQYQQERWTEITPQPGRNYSAIANDPQQPNTVVVAEYPFSPEGLHRTTDDGQTWRTVALDVDAVGWWPSWHLHTLMGSLAINPAQPKQVWLTTGFGVMRTDDITAQPSRWCTYMQNLEELVVFVVKRPPALAGEVLFSGVADLDGFRHSSLTAYPPQTYDRGIFGDTTGLDFAEADPNIIVRVGSFPGPGGREDGQNRSAYSADGGRTWQPFANVPEGAFNGKVAVSATLQPNGKPVIVWTPQGDGDPHRSLDGGQTWQPVSGAPNRTILQVWFPSQAIASDRVDGRLFYLFKYGEATGGSFYRSLDGGATWQRTVTNLPDHWIHTVKAAPGTAGDVWLSIDGFSLYRSRDAGQTFVPLAQIQAANTFTFGRPAPGRFNPTVFVDGVINQTEGLFRSDDATSLPGDAAQATWIKISTDTHALSNVTYLEGDREVFGRVYVGTDGRGILFGEPSTLP